MNDLDINNQEFVISFIQNLKKKEILLLNVNYYTYLSFAIIKDLIIPIIQIFYTIQISLISMSYYFIQTRMIMTIYIFHNF